MAKHSAGFENALRSAERTATGRLETGTDQAPRAANLTGIGHTLNFASPADADKSHASQHSLACLYGIEDQDGIEKQAPEVAKPALLLTSVADVLGLTLELSVDDLHRVRREFALTYHPDRVAPQLRDQSVQWMSEANNLIDAALAARRRLEPRLSRKVETASRPLSSS
jgi:hypothetical protein